MHNAAVQRLTRDAPVIAFFGAVCLLCWALLLFAAAPRWSAYRERLERVKHYDKYITSAGGFDEMRRRLESVNERLQTKLDGVLMEEPSRTLPDVLQALIRHGNDCGIVLARIQPLPETKSENSEYVPVFLETTADYRKLGKYVASLEALPHILQIRKLSIETAKGGELSARLLVSCRITANAGGYRAPEAVASMDMVSIHDAFALADSALNAEIVMPAVVLISEANSPFKSHGAEPAARFTVSAVNSPVKPERPRLTLKGLMKNPPLAIIEDARGETHIRAQGEFIQHAQIIAISNNSVVLKDSSGTHELIVEENR